MTAILLDFRQIRPINPINRLTKFEYSQKFTIANFSQNTS